MNRHYYALSDAFTGDYPREYTSGFAMKRVIAFESYAERKKWLSETKLLTAKAITRKEALKMCDRVEGVGENDVEYRAKYCGCDDDYVVIYGYDR